ncbi:MAG: tetratricopeptide repeat protein [Candidatus Promineofilum sp.]|nr:tetratricopeptide repeat protein [Promineifilum sp.]
MGRLALSLLGPMWVTQGSRAVAGFEYDKVRALLVYLALEADRPHRREMLAGLLWPEQPEKAARDSLRNALATLRQAIGDADADPPYLFITREAVQFNADSDFVLDVAEVKRWLEQAGRHRHRNPETCRICAAWRREAAGLYRGPLLAQFSLPDSPEFEYWLLNEREQLHRVVMGTFQRLADYSLLRDENDAAHFFAGRQLAYEPWHEGAHRQAMRALAAKGDRSAALMQYQACVRALDEELGVKPEAETILLFDRIRDGVPLPERSTHTVAAPTAPLIGRERDLARLGRRLADPDVRLITIVGLGGIGKTSLAREAGGQFSHDFTDGAIFVSLVTAVEPSDVFPAIAAAAGLRLEPSSSPLTQVGNYLRSRELLLILDNFEHLTAGASLLIDLMAAAPRLVLLVTSRQRLGLSVEWLYELRGLDFPAENATHPLAEFAALQLFARRVRQERGNFALVSSEALAAADICRLVQGMPLAIELAAAAAGVRSTAEIARQLHVGLDALAVEWADLPLRHRSLQALIDWSYDLLSPVEQRLLRRLSVFAGGFTLEAAEMICDEENEGNVPGSLTKLVNNSLVVVDRAPGRETRYDLHEMIRQYALAKLVEEGAEERLRGRHGAFFCRLAEEAEPRLYSGEQMAWLDRLDAEHDNLRAALDWSFNSQAADVEYGLRLAAALTYYWEIRGLGLEGGLRLASALEKIGDAAIPLQALLYLRAGSFWIGWENEKVALCARKSLALFQKIGDEKGIAWAIRLQGNLNYDQGDREQAVPLLEQSLKLAGKLDDRALITWNYHILGWIAVVRADYSEAANVGDRGLALAYETGDGRAQTSLLFLLGETANRQGEFARAEALYSQALIIARNLKDSLIAARILNQTGEAARRQKKYIQAEASYLECLAIFRDVHGWEKLAVPLSNLGHVAVRRGDPGRAVHYFQESIESDEEISTWNIWGMGVVAAALGRPRQAARLYAVVDKLVEADIRNIVYREDREDFRRDVDSVREQLDEASFTAAWAEGRAMSPEEAIAYALKG